MYFKPVSSQLGNFIDNAASGSISLEVEDARKQSKLEAQARTLNTIANDLVKIHASLTALPTVGKDQRVLILSQAIGKIRRFQENGLPLGSARPVRHTINELVSMREAVLSGTPMKKRDFVAVVMTDAIKAIRASHESAAEKLQVVKSNRKGSSFISPKEQSIEEIYKKAGEVIKRSTSEKDSLESIGTKPFVIARVPIVPVASPNIDASKLKRLGIKSDSIANYPVIHNQIVLGINREVLEKTGKGGKSETAREAAERIANIVSKQHRTVLNFVTDKGYPYKSAVWYWLAPKQEINALSKAANGRLNIQQWGFAF